MNRLRARPAAVLIAPAVILLGPVVVVVLLGLPLVNQLEYADAWFYSAYAWTPRHHFALFEWNYFSVRFPAILSIGVFERVLGVHGGYVVLRYLLAVASGAAVYLGVRRVASASIAAAAAGLLYLNPFFSRMLLWDYAGFVVVSAGVVGFSLWWWSESRRLAWTALPGTALAIALYANVIVAIGLVVLFAVELASAVRLGRRALIRLALRVAIAVGSAIVVLVVGYVSYTRFSALSPDDLLRPTIDFLLSNEQNAAPYQQPISQWLEHELRIWPPVITSLALISILGRRVLATDLPARIAQVCIGYTAFVWIYRFAVTSSGVETWWAYDILVMVTAPAIGVLLQALVARWPEQKAAILVAVGVTAAGAIAIRSLDNAAEDTYSSVSTRPALLFTAVAVAVGGAVALAFGRRFVVALGLASVMGALCLMSWAPSVFDGRGATGVFARDSDLEWDMYAGAHEFVDIYRRYDAPRSLVYTWYPDPSGPEAISWATLPQYGRTVHEVGLPAPMDVLQPLGRARLIERDVAFVLAMSEQQRDLVTAQRALKTAGFASKPVEAGTLGDQRVHYVVLQLVGKPLV